MSSVLIWVESYGGSGHLNLSVNIARELKSAGHSVTIASSNLSKNTHVPYSFKREDILAEEIDILDMPVLMDETGELTENKIERRFDSAWHEKRRNILETDIETQKYDAIIVESWPFTRSPVYDIELTGLVEAAHSVGAKLYTTVIDIPSVSNRHGYQGFRRGRWGGDPETCMKNIRTHGFEIIPQGDSFLHPFSENYPEFQGVTDLVHELGYFVRNGDDILLNDLVYHEDKPVLVAVGGTFGYDAKSHLETGIQSRKYSGQLSNNPWHIFVPMQASEEDFEELKRLAKQEDPDGKIIVQRNSLAYKDMIPDAALVLIKGAYNSTMEALLSRTPFVTAPIGKNEQIKRSQKYQEKGIAPILLTPETSRVVGGSISAPTEPEAWGGVIDQCYKDRIIHTQNMGKVNTNGLKNFVEKLEQDLSHKPLGMDHQFSIVQSETFAAYEEKTRNIAWKHSIKSAYPEAKAFILDWDETCVDNFGLADFVFAEVDKVMADRGCDVINAITLADKRGATAPYNPKDFFALKYGAVNGADAYDLYEKIYFDVMDEFIVENNGLEYFLQDCNRQGIPVVVVSNSPAYIVQRGRDILSLKRSLSEDCYKNLHVIGTGDGVRYKPDTHMMEMAFDYLEKQYLRTHGRELEVENVYSVGDTFSKDGVPSIKMGFNYISMRTEYQNQLFNMNVQLTVDDFEHLAVYSNYFLRVPELEREY